MSGPSRRGIGRKALAGGVAVAVHLAAAGLAFLRPAAPTPPPSPPDVVTVRLVPPPEPPAPAPQPADAPAEAAASSAPPAPAPSAPQVAPPAPAPAARPRPAVLPPSPEVEPLAVAAGPTAPDLPLLGAAQMAGAVVAGPGQGGGSGSGAGSGSGQGAGDGACDMVRLLQDALRGDPRIRRAAEEAHAALNASGRAMLIWDGDWLQSRGEAGKGLAGVRQAVALEVAFAPAECRDQPMRGVALVALDDRPGGVRLALGRGHWRWSDLLGLSR